MDNLMWSDCTNWVKKKILSVDQEGGAFECGALALFGRKLCEE